MWSANRDDRCSAQVDTSHPSNTCSGVEQQPGQFATTFAELTSLPPVVTAAPATTANAPTRDDPATAPYPIWRDTKTYTQGAKVVWHAGVYQAKWFSQANMPDAPVTHTWDTPWRYLGPVLPTDKPYLTAQSSTAGNIADWTPDRLYQSGDTAQFGGLTFKARWGNQHVQPDPDPDRPSDVPWTIVTDGS
jgi:chitinase